MPCRPTDFSCRANNIIHMKVNRLPRAGIDLLLYGRCTRCRLEPGFNSSCTNGGTGSMSKKAHKRHRGTQEAHRHAGCMCVLRTLYMYSYTHTGKQRNGVHTHLCIYEYINFFSKKSNLECSFFIGGGFAFEDGLAPSGGEGWAPPHARAHL